MHHRGKEFDWQRVIFRIETALVPPLAKHGAVIELGAFAVRLPFVWVGADVLCIISVLKVSKFFGGAGIRLSNERVQDRGGVLILVIGYVNVTDVVQKG